MSETNETVPSFTPDQTVASAIMAELVTKGLVRDAEVKRFELKLASGKLSSTDWKNEIDLATAPKSNE